ncbi:MAG: GDP-mannose 4,6-dehydratase [Thermoproteus sp.]
MVRVLITGVTGQDGAWLAKYLLNRGYEVWGVLTGGSRRQFLAPTGIRHRV